MNVEIGAEASLVPEKEYKNGIAVAVHEIYLIVNRNIFTYYLIRKHFLLVLDVLQPEAEREQVHDHHQPSRCAGQRRLVLLKR